MAFFRGPHLITDNLILLIDPANTKSYVGTGTDLIDLSNEHYNGTLSAVTFDSGNMGNFAFNGINSYITLGTNTPKLYPGVSDYTWNGWLKFGGFTGLWREIWYGNAGGGHYGFGLALYSTSNNLRIDVTGTIGGNQQPAISTTSYLNSWHYWSFVIVQSTFQILIYVDSILISTKQYNDWGSINQGPSAPLIIGAHSATTWYYDSNISTIMVYNRALSQSEILQNYKALKNRFI